MTRLINSNSTQTHRAQDQKPASPSLKERMVIALSFIGHLNHFKRRGEDKGRMKPKAHHLQYPHWLISFHSGACPIERSQRDVILEQNLSRHSRFSLQKKNNFPLFVVNSAIVALIVLTAKLSLLWCRFTDSALTECRPQDPKKPSSSVNTALLIDALLREHKEPLTDCHKRLRRSEKKGAAGACSRRL